MARTLCDSVLAVSILPATYTNFTLEALKQTRHAHTLQWSAIALLSFVVYVYAVEVERERWDMVAAGFAVLLADGFNEMVNALVLHFTHASALWTETGTTSYQFTVGLNLETMFMFAISGIVFAKMLPKDRHAKILGLPNRFVMALGVSMISVAVEVLLHSAGRFHWHYWFWGLDALPVIVVFGYLWFYMFAGWVYDAQPARRWQLVGGLAGVDLIMILLFGVALGWL